MRVSVHSSFYVATFLRCVRCVNRDRRTGKQRCDGKSFYGAALDVDYAPECEDVTETREKLSRRCMHAQKKYGATWPFLSFIPEPSSCEALDDVTRAGDCQSERSRTDDRPSGASPRPSGAAPRIAIAPPTLIPYDPDILFGRSFLTFVPAPRYKGAHCHRGTVKQRPYLSRRYNALRMLYPYAIECGRVLNSL